MANFNVHSIMVENDLEDCGLETVSQHRSAVVLLRFGSDLEGRRLRRPRYQAENNPSLVIGEDFGELSRATPGRRKRLPSKFFARLSHRTRDTLSLAAVAYKGGTFCGAGGVSFRRTS